MLDMRRRRMMMGAAQFYHARWGLVSHWKLDEASGTRLDSYGTNHLTDNNTVTQAAGILGNAAQFTESNTEYLSVADNANVSTGNVDFWLSAWVYLDSKVGPKPIVEKRQADNNGNAEFLFRYVAASDRFQFGVGNGVGALDLQDATALGSPTLATWYFVLGWYRFSDQSIHIRVNHGTENSKVSSTPPTDTAYYFGVGAGGTITGSQTTMNGRIDSLSFGKSPSGGIAGVIDDISSQLYGSGAGLEFPWPA